ncbi:hypothetical protein [Desulfopila inferna]|uniref:hypothetical protein n=1 Tax=Desulfopila inferna TaxID=468528 RepID=UPI001965F600|nr:hypothetical protein [Desulfopila inferna]
MALQKVKNIMLTITDESNSLPFFVHNNLSIPMKLSWFHAACLGDLQKPIFTVIQDSYLGPE